MPEFEEDKVNASQSETYTPSTDASDKPRTRRRSGGFKTEVAPISNAKIGEVDAAKALKEEKLSGQPGSGLSEKPARRERSERKPRAEREPRPKREPREPRESKAPRSDANPQPSPETLAAIASVEAKITERRAERDARRAERNKNRPAKAGAKSGGKSDAPRSGTQNPAAKAESSEGGLIAAIGGFFGKLFGNAPEPAPKKKAGSREGQGRGGRPQGKSGNRGGQGRGGRPQGKGGNRGGQGRKRGGKGPRRSDDRRSNENVPS